MDSIDLNYLAVVAATIANMVLGYLWYGPLLGTRWLAAVGRSEEEITPPSPLKWVLVVLGALGSAVTLAVVIDWASADELLEGVAVGAIAAVGFLVADSIKYFVYEDRSITLLAINNSYILTGFVIMGAILGAWT